MPDKFPVTSRTDILPSKNPSATKEHGESFNEAMNPPNNPTKNYQPKSFNVTDDYCDDQDSDD